MELTPILLGGFLMAISGVLFFVVIICFALYLIGKWDDA